ncbi:hypothetical protein DPMN_140931 [Dreissena polymorpha]|uniref:Uncharacterized protein n=1 Tax=Dreissena polymorpha TaxID=45954 RepID=A0A9D4JH44_DREPO|nr:hypothetical protein DPMN_140931 [Dreissena polymorpha]
MRPSRSHRVLCLHIHTARRLDLKEGDCKAATKAKPKTPSPASDGFEVVHEPEPISNSGPT